MSDLANFLAGVTSGYLRQQCGGGYLTTGVMCCRGVL